MVVFVCGGPGSGKGTNCTRLAEEFNYCHLSAGDLLRAEVAAKSKRGMELETIMLEGKLVPDEITIELLKNAMLANQSKNGFLIDGFPRSVEQAVKFETDVAECHMLRRLNKFSDVNKLRVQRQRYVWSRWSPCCWFQRWAMWNRSPWWVVEPVS